MTDKYKVTSGRVSGCELGDTVTAADLPGAHLPALVAAGHLKPVQADQPKKVGK